MVLPGERDYMATRPERSKTLHNFTLPNLKWGSQRHLKCMKVDSMSSGSGEGDHRLRRRSPPLKFAGSSLSIPFRCGKADDRSNKNYHHRFKSVQDSSDEGIEEFRVKIMSDLKTVRDKITQSMFRKDSLGDQDEERQTEHEKEREISPVKPWNLRKRRAACKEPISGNQYNSSNLMSKGFVFEERICKLSPARGGVAEAEKKERRTNLSVQLPKKDIDDDFMAVLGHRPPRRPKKRPKMVQKKLDNLFPGLYLTEVTLDAYKVPEEGKSQQR